MANTNPEIISYIKIGDDVHPIDAVSINGKTVSQTITNNENEIPSSAAIWSAIGKIEERLNNI